MAISVLLRGVNLLKAEDEPARREDVRLRGGCIERIGPKAAAGPLPDLDLEAGHLWLGPALIDPHSVLEDPRLGRAETLSSLMEAAVAGGYGTVALLPWGPVWRDQPESLALPWDGPGRLLVWGSFSAGGEDRDLAGHGDQVAAGAVGLACGPAVPPLALLERGLRLGEMGRAPVLVAPRDPALSREGFVRERVEALRAGLPVDPVLSETIPLQSLLALANALPRVSLRLMNLSTAEAVQILAGSPQRPQASVSWWHLVADSASLDPSAEGWRVVPSLGAATDREALITALASGLISAVAVQHEAMDAEERLLPLDQRRPGLAGHGLVLPMLWRELVRARGWPPEQLWRVLCWGPARFLAISGGRVEEASQDWILFDPLANSVLTSVTQASKAANRPGLDGEPTEGRVVASGLSDPGCWSLPGCQPC